MSPAKLTHSAPVLFVSDLKAAAVYYRDAMGFRVGPYYGNPEDFVILARDQMHVMLKTIPAGHVVVPRTAVSPGLWDMYFWVDDVEALFAEFVSRGAKIDYDLCDQPYGCREFGAQDLDGHDIGFGQSIATPGSVAR